MRRQNLRFTAAIAAILCLPSAAMADGPSCSPERAELAAYNISPALPAGTAANAPVSAPISEPVYAPAVRVVESAPQTTRPPAINPQSEPEMLKTPAVAPAVSAYANLLARRISEGADDLFVFDYEGAKSAGELAAVAAYVEHLEAQNPDAMSANDATAFWANLYNAVTVRVILENYPVKSIKKIGGGLFGGGPWKKEIINVGGRALSLDNVEHDILRKDFASPYIHYMVNCASIGCPNLQPTLWEGETMDAKRKAAARAYINSNRGVTRNGNKLVVSNIYDWFKEDFGGSKSGVLAHITEYADPDLRAAIDDGAKISGYAYDWSLNE